MRIFLTGGTGFIGSHLLRELLLAGHKVLAIRRPGSLPAIPLEQNPVWLERSLLQIKPSDLEGIEVCIHLASAGVSPQKASWQEMELINVGEWFTPDSDCASGRCKTFYSCRYLL